MDNVGVTDRFFCTGANKENFGDAITIFYFAIITLMSGHLGNGLPIWIRGPHHLKAKSTLVPFKVPVYL